MQSGTLHIASLLFSIFHKAISIVKFDQNVIFFIKVFYI